jgi:riboflavin kinase / FMN adenylyltransferase
VQIFVSDISIGISSGMQIIRDLKTFRPFTGTTLTIGNFDGIHLGHRLILREVCQKARRTKTESVVITFNPHPLAVLHPSRAPQLITPFEEKIGLLAETGIDCLLILPFDLDLAHLTGREFVERILVNIAHVKNLYVGKNFHFGHQRSGTVSLLESMGRKYGFEVYSLPEVIIRKERVSSTWIRQLIKAGRLSMANRILGRFYTLHGPVIRGEGVGSRLLLPTLNLHPENDILPKPGVYVSLSCFDQAQYPSVTNIGCRPTLGGQKLTIETHLLNQDLSVPPKRLELALLHRLRDEIKFHSVDELKNQIKRDCHTALRFFRFFMKLHPIPLDVKLNS